jgi:hypothetical protein
VIEAALALGACVALAAGALAFAVAPATLLVAGGWTIAVGLALGLPTGAIYHLALRRALLARTRLPARWWLVPTALHDELGPGERGRVLAWCYAGAAGFAVTVAGCALVALAAWRGFG